MSGDTYDPIAARDRMVARAEQYREALAETHKELAESYDRIDAPEVVRALRLMDFRLQFLERELLAQVDDFAAAVKP